MALVRKINLGLSIKRLSLQRAWSFFYIDQNPNQQCSNDFRRRINADPTLAALHITFVDTAF